jgi:hypothetical protein
LQGPSDSKFPSLTFDFSSFQSSHSIFSVQSDERFNIFGIYGEVFSAIPFVIAL